MKELAKAYDAKQYEADIYKRWEESGFFDPGVCVEQGITKKNAVPFCIIMPPPNANGSLHLGHALYCLQDIMARYHRMRGEPTLYLPGADHAGFETQVVYDKKLEKAGRKRSDIPRADLYREIWDFTQSNKQVMEQQLRQLGMSCDWSREKFTLDPDIIKTVYATFKRLYADGLVYRENRIVNWCTKHQTTLSDLEIKHVERQDPLYYIKYGPVTLATIRLETKFGDTAVAVHPKDKRYRALLGKDIEIQTLLGKTKIKVIADEAVDPEFGTGAVKVTPAHDPNDFEIWKRHEKEIPGPKPVIDQYGRMDLIEYWPDNPAAKKYHGLKVLEAREVMAADMQAAGLMEKVDSSYAHNVATCYKCGNIVEPRILPQWYIRMTAKPSSENPKSLRDLAVEAVKKGEVKFIPKSMEKTFMQWMKNLRDWNISRQIVWGIRIPVWYCKNAKCKMQNAKFGVMVSIDDIKDCPDCGGEVEHDSDVFDTWFSSGQWPFAALGYPEGKDYKEFYPTSVMETGWDILFFWVARMIMLGLYATGEVPFRHVYLHGLVRDRDRQKMSKSKGNVIDPLGVIGQYGADALRLALVVGNTPGSDILISEEKIKGYRNFANKVWNISRFVLMRLDAAMVYDGAFTPSNKREEEIIAALKTITKQVTTHIDQFRFYQAAEDLYHYIWHEFADVIIEEQKPRLDGPEGKQAQKLLLHLLAHSLKLLHPFMPFVTEAVWQSVPMKEKRLLMVERWPH